MHDPATWVAVFDNLIRTGVKRGVTFTITSEDLNRMDREIVKKYVTPLHDVLAPGPVTVALTSDPNTRGLSVKVFV